MVGCEVAWSPDEDSTSVAALLKLGAPALLALDELAFSSFSALVVSID